MPSDDLKEYTRIIIQEADRLQNLMNRMLGPNALPHKRSINIHEVLEHVRGLVLAETGSQICIDRDYDPSIPARPIASTMSADAMPLAIAPVRYG